MNVQAYTTAGRPIGNEEFVKCIEGILGRSFKVRPRGRPKKEG